MWYVLTVSSILVFTAVFTSPTAIAQNSTEFITYTDTNNGFTLQYPSDWTKNDTTTQNSPFTLYSPDNSALVFAIIFRPMPPDLTEVTRNMTLDELVKSVVLPAGALSLPPNELSTLGINIVELNSEGYFLSGHPAGRIVATFPGSDGSPNTKSMVLTTIVNDGLYAISYKADTTTYNQYFPDAQAIIDSFKIISNQ